MLFNVPIILYRINKQIMADKLEYRNKINNISIYEQIIKVVSFQKII